jgi:hypothetical protein
MSDEDREDKKLLLAGAAMVALLFRGDIASDVMARLAVQNAEALLTELEGSQRDKQ